MDALMDALKVWRGGVVLISHDERFINNVCNQLWVCADGTLSKWLGDVSSYKVRMASCLAKEGLLIHLPILQQLIVGNRKDKPT